MRFDKNRALHNLALAVKSATDEYITRKQRQPELLGSVLPPVGGGVEREKYFMAPARKDPGNWLLVLVASVKCMPLIPDAGILNFRFVLHQTHVAPPCDLHRRFLRITSPRSNSWRAPSRPRAQAGPPRRDGA